MGAARATSAQVAAGGGKEEGPTRGEWAFVSPLKKYLGVRPVISHRWVNHPLQRPSLEPFRSVNVLTQIGGRFRDRIIPASGWGAPKTLPGVCAIRATECDNSQGRIARLLYQAR